MHTRDIIVIGGSAGAYEALVEIASGLHKDLPAAVFLVLHTRHRTIPMLTTMMTNASPLPVSWAVDGESIQPGHIYLAPGDHNLLIERGRVRVLASPKEHALYPSIDALFRTAALA